jgi:membrane protein
VSHSSFNLIYGAFAVVPLFLLWVNISWMVILGGAVLVRSIELYQVDMKDRGYPDFFGCLLVLWQFHEASHKGNSVSNYDLLHLGLSSDQWQRIREVLLSNTVIAATQQNEFVLSRDLARLSLNDLRNMLGVRDLLPANISQVESLPWFANAQLHLGYVDNLESERFNLSVEAFFDGR